MIADGRVKVIAHIFPERPNFFANPPKPARSVAIVLPYWRCALGICTLMP